MLKFQEDGSILKVEFTLSSDLISNHKQGFVDFNSQTTVPILLRYLHKYLSFPNFLESLYFFSNSTHSFLAYVDLLSFMH